MIITRCKDCNNRMYFSKDKYCKNCKSTEYRRNQFLAEQSLIADNALLYSIMDKNLYDERYESKSYSSSSDSYSSSSSSDSYSSSSSSDSNSSSSSSSD